MGLYVLDQSMKNMQSIRNNVLLRSMYPEIKTTDVHKDWFLLGFDNKGDMQIDCREAWRAVILGKTRLSGKTMKLRRMMDLAYLSGWNVCWITDVKNEARSSSKPQLSQFQKLLPSNNKPQGINIISYRPHFFNKFIGDTARMNDNEDFIVPYSELTIDELKIVLDTKNNEDAQKIVMKHYKNCKSLEELRRTINNDSCKESVKRLISSSIDNLLEYQVFPEKGNTKEFIEHLKTKAVAFNLYNYEKVNIRYIQVYIKIIQRIIIDAKHNKVLGKRLLLIYDEASNFLDDKMLSRDEIKILVDRQAYFGVYIVFAMQSFDEKHRWLYSQCRYIFCSASIDIRYIFQVLKFSQVYYFHPSDFKELADQLKEVKSENKGYRVWIKIDTFKKGNPRIYSAYPSLSRHMTSSL